MLWYSFDLLCVILNWYIKANKGDIYSMPPWITSFLFCVHSHTSLDWFVSLDPVLLMCQPESWSQRSSTWPIPIVRKTDTRTLLIDNSNMGAYRVMKMPRKYPNQRSWNKKYSIETPSFPNQCHQILYRAIFPSYWS